MLETAPKSEEHHTQQPTMVDSTAADSLANVRTLHPGALLEPLMTKFRSILVKLFQHIMLFLLLAAPFSRPWSIQILQK